MEKRLLIEVKPILLDLILGNIILEGRMEDLDLKRLLLKVKPI